ncbi:MAG: molecular chaperone DnaJ, partial [Eggerthellaceae bacterium]|nr:molecular chaperone DnaJ [Eggerthellaceae bacterium]
PEGCQNEQVVRVKGMGLPRLRAETRGDMYVHIGVIIPKKLTKKQRELLEKVAVELGEDVAAPRTPLQKLRDAFN